jgi:hypothetical protein
MMFGFSEIKLNLIKTKKVAQNRQMIARFGQGAKLQLLDKQIAV